MKLTHLSLFSGIGGIDLAAEWAGFKTVGQVEWADFQTKILEKHWPHVARWRDINEFTSNEFYKRTGIKKRQLNIISGGFPCQPHSQSGKRLAQNDERDLWPEMRRVICEIRPKWIVAENVSGLRTSDDGRFFRNVLGDIATIGYDAIWITVRASDFGAIHRRERVFTIAYPNSFGWDCLDKEQKSRPDQFDRKVYADWIARQISIRMDYPWVIPDTSCRQERNDDGLSEGMDRLKAIGNAVVPQQAYPIFKAIAEIEHMRVAKFHYQFM